jgi:hypothetical protein
MQICANVDKDSGKKDTLRFSYKTEKAMNLKPLSLSNPEVQEKLKEALAAAKADKLLKFGQDVGEAIALAEQKNLFIF